ncbi:MAG TPA: hypothetical protein VH374_02990 [Polyangia bacterium]|jgi:hypothetical protein|nr:hypothetical protein [Polyangia bacterium]
MPQSLARKFTGLAATADRKRWRAEDAAVVLSRLESSGLSVPEFAARERLEPQRLYRWRAQVEGTLAAARSKAAPFVEIKTAATACIEVVLRSGHTLRVPAGFDGDTLRQLVTVLEGGPPQC